MPVSRAPLWLRKPTLPGRAVPAAEVPGTAERRKNPSSGCREAPRMSRTDSGAADVGISSLSLSESSEDREREARAPRARRASVRVMPLGGLTPPARLYLVHVRFK